MPNLPNPPHPTWCLRGPDCADGGGLHVSTLTSAAPRGDEVIQIRAGLWGMDTPSPSMVRPGIALRAPGGLLLELSCGEDVERWPVDLAQSHALLPLLSRLLGPNSLALPRAA